MKHDLKIPNKTVTNLKHQRIISLSAGEGEKFKMPMAGTMTEEALSKSRPCIFSNSVTCGVEKLGEPGCRSEQAVTGSNS
jgi:hypothetical protein